MARGQGRRAEAAAHAAAARRGSWHANDGHGAAMSKTDAEVNAVTVAALVQRISPILSGHPPEIQSATLADLTAMWLAGMQDIENPENAELLALRADIFAMWCRAVTDLVPANVAIIRERLARLAP
jgi:hypothetical protein